MNNISFKRTGNYKRKWNTEKIISYKDFEHINEILDNSLLLGREVV